MTYHGTSIHNGLAIYRFGRGEPIFLVPGPHRFARPGLPMTDALIKGLTELEREVITFDPPGSGRIVTPSSTGITANLIPRAFASKTIWNDRPAIVTS